jgi:hypothetical protein
LSSGSNVAVLPPLGRRGVGRGATASIARELPLMRLFAFGAFAFYGALRWATLLHPAPTWRALGMVAVALGVVALGLALEGRYRWIIAIAGVLGLLAMFAFSGVPLHWVRHLRIAATANGVDQGLSSLPRVLVPYGGLNRWTREVIMLGAGVLLLTSALTLALAPRPLTDARRAVCALPLLTLAVLPSTLSRPPVVYVHGLLLFGLLALFVWGERLERHDYATVVGLPLFAAALAMAFAPALDSHKPWIDYQALTSSLAPGKTESFDWTQRYTKLNWPRKGHEVLDVRAAHPDYWKAENLDLFNGTGWMAGEAGGGNQLDGILPSSLDNPLWSQTMTVTIRAMKTFNVIGAGFSSSPVHTPTGATPGASQGTWTASNQLGPGDSYSVRVYDPHPSPAQLASAGDDYPGSLISYRTLVMPQTALANSGAELVFPPFHSFGPLQAFGVPPQRNTTLLVRHSPYGGAYALALRLKRKSTTPYSFVQGVMNYLSHGFSYNEDVPTYRYPLESFLFKDKFGYCQQFAGAMAMLLRMGGIPARVAVGFTTGNYDNGAHDYVVGDVDAHAWVEAWFPRYGWVRFDPTPAVAPARGGKVAIIPAGIAPKAAGLAGAGTHGLGAATAAAAAAGKHHSHTSPLVWIIPLALLVALAIALLFVTRAPKEPSAEQMLAELETALARSGRPVATGVTLAELERRFRISPDAAAYIHALRMARFGGDEQLPTSEQRRALRAQLRAGLGMGAILRAMWALPPRWRPPSIRLRHRSAPS